MTCCQLIDEFLMLYLDGELPPDQRRAFDEHLCTCPECVAYIETYRVTVRVTRVCCCEAPDDGPCPPAPDRLVQAILAAFQKKV